MRVILKDIFRSPYFILLIAVLAANWQLVFLQSGMEWDMMNFWMPWRYFMSECYNNGIVPLWDPYTQSGYPLHGDLQGPAYSPEAILVSFLFGQNIYILNYCFVFYLFIAAVGMYKLTLFFTQKKDVSVLGGIIYSMSGFNVAHGHYFYIIVSVALVPLIFYYFFKILNGGTYLDALKLSLIIFWHITTGNPSFLIISGYLMAFCFIGFAAWKIKGGYIKELFGTMKIFSAVVALSVLMALPVIYNAMQIIPLTTRKAGLDLAYAGDESFYFQNFIAFVIPLITITNVDLTGYEQELWSPYIGAFTIFFFLFALFLRKNFFEWMLLFIGMAGLLIALGLQWPVYPFLHRHLPLFNVFRMPNLSLLFFLMLAIIMASKYLSDEERTKKLFSRHIHWYLSAIWLVAILFMFYTAKNHQQDGAAGLFDNFKNLRQWIYAAKPAQIALFHAYLFGSLILVLLVTNFSVKNKLRTLLIVMAFDVLANYQLGGIARIFSVENAKEMNEYFSRFPKGFAVPETVAMERVSAISKDWRGYWLNTSVFNKQPDHPNSNNFELITYLDLLLNKPKLAKNVFKNSYAFFADSLMAQETFIDSVFRTTKNAITLPNVDLEKLRSDSFANESNNFSVAKFEPNNMTYEVKNASTTAFVICQNYCPLWKFTLNGKAYKPFATLQGSFPVFLLPAGDWKIEATYSLPGFSTILLFSLLLFSVGILLVVYYSVAGRRTKIFLLAVISGLFLYCLIKFNLASVEGKEEKAKESCQEYAKGDGSVAINNTSFDMQRTIKTNFIRNEDLAKLQNCLDSFTQPTLTVINYDRYFSQEAQELVEAAYGPIVKDRKLEGARSVIFHKHAKSKLIKDTLVTLGNIIDEKDPYSSGILIDSMQALKYQTGDLLVITAEIEADRFDFPGLSLEVNFSDQKKQTTYKYANVSFIRQKGIGTPVIIYKLTNEATGIKKIIAYVWNPSVFKARVRSLKCRIYRP